jgi:hypothetical protein
MHRDIIDSVLYFNQQLINRNTFLMEAIKGKRPASEIKELIDEMKAIRWKIERLRDGAGPAIRG